MKLKLDANGNVVVQEVNGVKLPVWEMPDGSDVAYDTPAAHKKIGELTTEAKTHRTEKEAALNQLKAFEGVDVESAKKALQFAQSMEGKKAMDDESIKTLIANAVKPIQDQLAEATKTIEGKDAHIYKLEVGNRFATSGFLKEKTILGETPDIAEAYFAKNFKVENGKVVPYDASGNQIYSRVKPGEVADFDEAVQILVESHPRRDHILKGSGASGSGAKQGQGGQGGGKTLNREAFTKLDPAAQMAHVSGGGIVTD